MKSAMLLFSMLMVTGVIGCSTHYRTTDSQISEDELNLILNEALGEVQIASVRGFDANSLANDPNTSIYVAMAEPGFNTMGTVHTVLSFDNINFIDPGVDVRNVSGARVVFLDNPGDGTTHDNMLIVGIQTSGVYQYYPFSGAGYFDGGRFVVDFLGNDGLQYTLATFDVEGDSLSHDIQLKLYTPDVDGSIGKFSILAGFQ